MRQGIFLAALLVAANAAQAQAVYRSVMPDGSIVYGDKPVPGARDAREVELPPPNISLPEPSSGPAAGRPSDGTGPKQPSEPGRSALDIAQEEVRLAADELDRARAALDSGREPHEGEVMGTAIPGRTRRTDAYQSRVQSLEDAVTRAQQRLDDALTRRNALR
jgi:hypothetical protein